jgi:hypothetical protein
LYYTLIARKDVMSTEDLKNILARMRTEADAGPAEPVPAAAPPPAADEKRIAAKLAKAPKPAPARIVVEEERVPAVVAGWRENKESMLFGTLCSLIMALGGVLSGLELVIYIGAGAFALFALIMASALAMSAMPGRASGSERALAARIDAVSQRLEALAGRLDSGGAQGRR